MATQKDTEISRGACVLVVGTCTQPIGVGILSCSKQPTLPLLIPMERTYFCSYVSVPIMWVCSVVANLTWPISIMLEN